MENKTNYLAILVCPLINMALGMGWYKIFAIEWMLGHGLSQGIIDNDPSGSIKYVLSVVGSLASAFVLNLIFRRMGVRTLADGLKSGAAIGFFGLQGTLISYRFAMHDWSIGFIDGGFAFLLFSLYGAVLGGWQKK